MSPKKRKRSSLEEKNLPDKKRKIKKFTNSSSSSSSSSSSYQSIIPEKIISKPVKQSGKGEREITLQHDELTNDDLNEDTQPLRLEENHASTHLLVNLDRLAWLLQKNTKSCASVCLINNKLLCSDNSINSGSTKKSDVVKYQFAVLNYIVLVANGNSRKKIKKERAILLRKIFEAKIKGEERGYLNHISKPVKKQIYDRLINVANNTFDSTMTTVKLQKHLFGKVNSILANLSSFEPKTYAAVGLCLKAVCRLRRLEHFFNEKQSDSMRLKQALTTQKKDKTNSLIRYVNEYELDQQTHTWLKDPKQNGFAIFSHSAPPEPSFLI